MVDVGGGRVSIEVVGDATGLREDVQSKVAEAVAGVSVKVPLEVDAQALRARVEAAARLAEEGQQVRLRVEAQTDRLRAELTEAAIEASAGEAAHVGVELESGAAERIRAHLEAVAAEGSAGVNAHIGVEVDRSAVRDVASGAETAAAEETASAAGSEAAGASSAAGANEGLGISALGAAAALAILTGGLGAATGAAGALVGMIAPLGGLLAAIPAGLSVMGAGIGTAFAGLHGVLGAVQALGRAQTAQGGSGGGAASMANAQAAAAQRIEQAHQQVANSERQLRDAEINLVEQRRRAAESLANTEYQVAQQRVQDARSVIAAEYQLGQAEQSATDAERALTEARQQAQRQLEDLANAATDAAFAQQDAQLALQSAQANAAQVAANPNATALQREQAALQVQEAQQRLKEATEQTTRAQQDNTAAQAKGVDGSNQVISATEQVASAQHAVQQAIVAVADAQRKQQRDAVTGAQQIRNAQESLRDTYRTTAEQVQSATQAVANAQRSLAAAERATASGAGAVGGAANRANMALDKLSPSARRFALQIRAILDGPLKELERNAQNAMVPGLSRALEMVAGPNGLWPQLNRLVGATGTGIGILAEKFAAFATSRATRAFLDQLGPATHRILVSLGTATASWGAVFRDFAGAALPLVERLVAGFAQAGANLDRFFSSRRGMADLRSFFAQVYQTTHEWGQILKNLGGTLLGILRAAVPAGNSLNTSFAGVTKHWSEWVNSTGGQQKIRDFFDKAVPVVRAMATAIADIVKALVNSAGDKGWANLFRAISAIAPLAGSELTAIAKAFGWLTENAKPLMPVLGPLAIALVNLWAAMKLAKGAHEAVKGVGDGLDAIGKGVKVAKGVVAGLLTGQAREDGTLAERVAARIGGAFHTLGAKVGPALQKLDDVVLGKLKDLAGKAADAAKAIATKIAERIKGGGDAGFLNVGAGAGADAGSAARTAELEAQAAAAQAAAGAETELAAAETEADVALTANPIGLIVLAVVALGVAVYEGIKHWRGLLTAAKAVGSFFKDVFYGALHLVAGAFDWVRDHAKVFAAMLLPMLGPIGLVVNAFLNWRAILRIVGGVFGDLLGLVQDLPGEILDGLSALGGMLARFFRAAFRVGEAVIKEYLSIWLDLYVRWPIQLFERLARFGSQLYSHFKTWFSEATHAVRDALGSALSFVAGLPGRVWSALSGFATSLYSHARGWFGEVLHGFRVAASDVWTWLKGVPGTVLHELEQLPQQMYDMGVKIIEELGKGIAHAAKDAGGSLLNGVKGAASSIVNHLNPFGDTKEGPMSRSGVGGPDKMGARLMAELAVGIERGRSRVAAAVADVARTVALGDATVDVRARVAGAAAGAVPRPYADDPHAGYGQTFEFAPGAIVVTNAVPEPASRSIATRMRRLAVMHEPLPRATTTRRPA